jgi:glycosyltransferase involved in cell wall biosynthesis
MLLFYLPKAIKEKQPDIIIGNFYEYPGLIVAKLFRNTRLVLDVRASVGKTGISGLVERILYYTAIKISKYIGDGVTVASPVLKEELCAHGIDSERVEVITNGVSLDVFDFKKNIANYGLLRKQFNLSDRFVIMYHGSLGPLRGLSQTIEAIASIKSDYPNIFFFILGSGSKNYEDSLKNLIEKESLQDSVYIHEPVSYEQVPRFLSMCDLGILALATFSYPRTSCPLKLLEYLAMEKPVISTDIPFSRAIFEHGVCGMLIPSYSHEHIAAAIESLYERRNSFENMGRIGRDIVEKHYSWNEKAKDLESYLHILMS